MADPRNFLFSTKFPPDKILGTFSGTFTANAGGGLGSGLSYRTESATNHTYGEMVFTKGIYSTDAGTTWNDFDVTVPDLTTPTQPILQTVDVQSYATSTQIVIVAANFYNVNKTVMYKVAAIAVE